MRPPFFAIKAAISDASASSYRFAHQKTMYGGKLIGEHATIFLFASENEGGSGLIAQGEVIAATATPRQPGVERQTPRVSITVRVVRRSRRPLGRTELKRGEASLTGSPAAELNFKFYRQATNKIVGISADAAAFLETHF